jgi:HAD superfamily hydrolase (TIGR01509 family)
MPHDALQAVLFDLDGTLTDTEGLWAGSQAALAARVGATLDDGYQEALMGRSSWDAVRLIRGLGGERGAAVPEDVAMEWLYDEQVSRLRTGPITRLPGGVDLVAAVRAAGLPTALVSSTWRRAVDVVLAAIGTPLFDVTITGDEVDRAKPDPQPYLLAAQHLGVPAAACVVVEDSPAGVASATAAGAAVVVVRSGRDWADAPRRVVGDDLTEIGLDDLRRLVATPLTG